MNFGDFKDLPKRTACNKVLSNKAFSIAKNPEYDGYQGGLTSMVYKCFDKKSSGGVTRARLDTSATRDKSAVKNKIILFRTNN